MQTFSPDNPIRLKFTFRDESGVGRVGATYRKSDGNGVVSLQGNGYGETETIIELTAGREREHIVPDEYHLETLVADNTRGFSKTYLPDDVSDDKRRFRYENYPDAEEESMDARTEIQQYLKGVEYPANRHQLAGAADNNDAPIDLIKTLLGMGSVEFSGPEDVIEELERLRDPSQNRPLGY